MGTITRIHPQADDVLEQAKGELKSAVVIGWDTTGELFAAASSDLSLSDVVFLIEFSKIALIQVNTE